MLIDKVADYQPQLEQFANLPREIYHDETAIATDITYRYCTEVLIDKNKKYDRAALETHLEQLGDSLVVSESAKIARIHLHTNAPAKMIAAAYQMGKIIENKADDMIAQNCLSHAQSGKIALVIDSIADIPKDRLTNIIIITVSAKMSGLYQRFDELLAEYKKDATIRLIDSKVNSVAEGLVVDRAIQLIKQGLTAEQIENKLNDLIKRTKIYVSVPNLKGMVASGRLNERLGRFLQYIGYLPLITVNQAGEGKVTGLAFSNKKNRELLLKTASDAKNKIVDYAIVHCDDAFAAQQLAIDLTAIIGKPPLYVDQISSVVKLFSGVGSVAIGYILGD